jgi:C_GCAxxG_C_C family probable redox protein
MNNQQPASGPQSSIERAAACFEEGFSCSQAVLCAYAPQFGLDPELALRVSGAFGGGMSRMGATCGAVTGAFMVIGLKHGKTRAEDDEAKEKTYCLAAQFVDLFKQRHGSILCRELLGCDLSTPEGRTYNQEMGISAARCPKFVQDAAEILEQMLLVE